MNELRQELPWAFAKKEGFEGKAPGLYFHYFRTKREAEKARRWCLGRGDYAGPVERRPNECHALGWI